MKIFLKFYIAWLFDLLYIVCGFMFLI